MNIGKPRARKQDISFLSAKDGYLFSWVHFDENRLSEAKNRSYYFITIEVIEYIYLVISENSRFYLIGRISKIGKTLIIVIVALRINSNKYYVLNLNNYHYEDWKLFNNKNLNCDNPNHYNNIDHYLYSFF